MAQPVLAGLTLKQLGKTIAQWGEPEYRARQIYEWVHRQGVLEPQRMTNLSLKLRLRLQDEYTCRPLQLVASAASVDGSVKYAWQTPTGNPVETVLMPGDDASATLCLSTHSGCPLGCRFCQTGYLTPVEALNAGLILSQLYEAERLSGITVDRLVFMGMGEPLLNSSALRQAVETLVSAEGRAWSARRITVSTVGLISPLREMADGFPRVNLALSLHFTTKSDRRQQMRGAEDDLSQLAQALDYYRRVNGGKISIEYALIAELNDNEDDAECLAQFARLREVPAREPAAPIAHGLPPRLQSLPLHVNLIAYNPIPAAPEYQPASDQRISEFAGWLSEAGVPVTVRRSRGADIAAACGMLGAAGK